MNLTQKMLLLSLIATACGHKNTTSESQVQHDLGRTVNSSSGYQWYEINEDQYQTKIADRFASSTPGPLSKAEVLAVDDPMTLRLQSWADRIDAMLRSRDPQSLAQTPKPKIRIIHTTEQNAFAAPVFLCLDLKTRVEGADQSAKSSDVLAYMRHDNQFGTATKQEVENVCLATNWPREKQVEALRWNLAQNTDCQITDDGEVITLSKTCADKNAGLKGVQGAERAMVMATADHVTVLSGYLTVLNESEMAAILAHELGHYYMSHITATPGTYGYFYWSADQNPDAKPKSDPQAEKLGQQLQNIAAAGLFFGDMKFRTIDQQRYHTSLLFPAYLLAPTLAEKQCGGRLICRSSCGQLVQTMQLNAPALQMIATTSDQPLDESTTQVYRDFEAKAQICFTESQLGSSPTDVSINDIATAFQQASPSWFKILPDPTNETNLDQLWINITTHLKSLEITIPPIWTALNKQALDQHLGYYTEEQEADELAVEWIANLGVDPAVAAQSWVKWTNVDNSFAMAQNDALPLRCEATAKLEWKDDKGLPVKVPLGSLEDPHHTACYRAWNMTREIAVHKLKVAEDTKQQAALISTDTPWDNLVARFK